MDNLTLAFPKMDDSERKSIAKSSYKNLALRLVEGIKNISIPKETLLERIKVENPQLMEDLFSKIKA
jgi:lauroyl/myristoyl acyltransferase